MSQPRPIDLWYTVCPVPAASSLAIARGEFEGAFAGSDATLANIRAHADRRVREAHYDQSQPRLFREGGNIPPIWSRSVGRNLRVIGLSWIEHYSRLLALPGSGINSAADLRGKRLALLRRPNDPVDYPRATALRAYTEALASAGLGPEDVTFVDVTIDEPLVAQPPEEGALSSSLFSSRSTKRRQGPELRALLTGKVDVIHGYTQNLELEWLLDAQVVVDVGRLPDIAQRINNISPIVFTVRGELLDERPDLVARYLEQAIRTARWARENQGEAKRLIARDSSIAEELVDLAYSPQVAAVLEPSLDPKLIDLLENQKNFLLRWGFIPNDFDVREWIAPGPLLLAHHRLETQRAT